MVVVGPQQLVKVMKFVDMAETFHLPVVYLVDCPGFQIGLQSEQAGTIKRAFEQ